MSDQSQMSLPGISPAIPNATSSPASGVGATLPVSPAGPKTARSGPGRARASRSPSRAKAPVSTTRGICGPTSFGSSVPPGPLSSWESRLRARLATVGSTECSLIWREKTTPAGASISRLAPWTPPTSDSASTGSQSTDEAEASSRTTPSATDHSLRENRYAQGGAPLTWQMKPRRPDVVASARPTPDCSLGGPDPTHRSTGCSLQTVMVRSPWPTPSKSDLEGGRTNPEGTSATGARPDGKKAQVGLPTAMKQVSPWATPAARDWRSDRSQKSGEEMYGTKGRPLARQMTETGELEVSTRSTPRASDGEKGGPNQSFGAGGKPLPAQMHAETGTWESATSLSGGSEISNPPQRHLLVRPRLAPLPRRKSAAHRTRLIPAGSWGTPPRG
jgi:hypothetical protein